MTRLIDGSVHRLRCNSCGATISHGGCSGDNDMVIFGLIGFPSLIADEVVIAEAEGTEYEGGFEATVSAVQRRVSMVLGRNDLCFVPILRTELMIRKGAQISRSPCRNRRAQSVLSLSSLWRRGGY